MQKLKGVGAATLDRGIAIVIGAVILGGIVAGIDWLYTQHKKSEIVSDVNKLSQAIGNYYKINEYVNVNTQSVERLKKANVLDKDFMDIAGHTFSVRYHGHNGGAEPYYVIKIDGMTYGECMALGQSDIINLKQYVIERTTGGAARGLESQHPYRNPSFLTRYESFCALNDGMSYEFWLSK